MCKIAIFISMHSGKNMYKVIAMTIHGGLDAHAVTCLGGLVYGW